MQQAGKRWFTSESSHAVDRIRQGATVEDKQLALNAYMDKKINVGRYSTPQHNAVILQQKLEQLHLQLCPQDAEQVMACGNFYIQHMVALYTQKALARAWTKGSKSKAAKVAFLADRQSNLNDALDMVMRHMCQSLHHHQGPCARVGALHEPRTKIEAALAFPKPAQWKTELDSFMQRAYEQAVSVPPGHTCKMTAQKLNNAESCMVSKIADGYFYTKIVICWNDGANQGHIQDKLKALLPLLWNRGVVQEVQASAEVCQYNMKALRQQKSRARY